MSHVSPVDSVGPTENTFATSRCSELLGRSTSSFPERLTTASRSVWDELSEQERREHLESMDPDALRAMAASMPVIEQAKGILMGCYGCDAAAAFSTLVRLSSARNVKLRELAATVVETASRQSEVTQGSAASPSTRVRRLLEDGS